MCTGTREELRVVWCSEGRETVGCTMSPWLFNLVMDNTVREVRESFQGGVQLEGNEVQFLLFADDLVLVAENEEDTKRN